MIVFKYLKEIRFDRNELSGAFGDIGTDFPLLVGMIIAAHLDCSSVLVMFGIMQIMTGLIYKIPMPVQPLKAMAVIMITQKLSANVLYGAGLAIGIVMLLLSLTKLINLIGDIVPKAVIRGIQFGLGLNLTSLALGDYVLRDGFYGYLLAGLSFIIVIFLMGNRKYPPALFVILLGALYAFFFKINGNSLLNKIGFSLPQVHIPSYTDIITGSILLMLPQLPLSIGNSIFATKQIGEDLFPKKQLSIRKISFTYSLMNLINPFFSGIPTCHGSGGMAGHYTFGGRTGGSVIIYGMLYIVLGCFFSRAFNEIVYVFPLPILGIILLFEGLILMTFIKDAVSSKSNFIITLLVGIIAYCLNYGFVIGIFVGTILYYLTRRGLTNLNN